MAKKVTFTENKKAVMGIETLIIFIAMILVAAVAAGVLLKTSGLLQQRALATGTEATQRIVSTFEIVSVTANVNRSANSFNEIETLVRLQSGSYDLDMLSLSYIFNSKEYAHPADIQHTRYPRTYNRTVSYLSNGTWVNIGSINQDPDITDDDHVRIIYNYSSTIDALEFNVTDYGLFNVSLGVDIENGSVVINNLPIKPQEDGNYASMFGFFNFIGNTTSTGGAINTSISGNYAYFTNALNNNGCDFNTLIPDFKFCVTTRIGNDNHVLEVGELMAIRYKLSTDKTIEGDTDLNLQFVPKRGNIIDIAIYVPEVLARQVVTLWP